MPASAQPSDVEPTAVPIPRRGRIWIVLALLFAASVIGYGLVQIATRPAGSAVVHVAGVADAQRIFGGVPQEGDRLGSSDAPVTIQVFNDLQCSNCRARFSRPSLSPCQSAC